MSLAGYDRDRLREQFRSAAPFPFIEIDPFLTDDFAREVAASYPSFGDAAVAGLELSCLNERGKIQISDSSKFPGPVRCLSDLIASTEFLEDLVYITGIPNLEADALLAGAGMHLTRPNGRLDVHVDFNIEDVSRRHRRLNILIYLNPEWRPEWGGSVELWDAEVKRCHHSFTPTLNRCLIFETSERSYHGVTPVSCPEGIDRKSFAAYYYTKDAPAGWDGRKHQTVFRSRPNERLRGYVLMPLERLWQRMPRKLRNGVKRGRALCNDLVGGGRGER